MLHAGWRRATRHNSPLHCDLWSDQPHWNWRGRLGCGAAARVENGTGWDGKGRVYERVETVHSCDPSAPRRARLLWQGALTTSYFLLPTCYFLLATHYSLLTTYYLLTGTPSLARWAYYLLLTTYYLLLTTYYLLLTDGHAFFGKVGLGGMQLPTTTYYHLLPPTTTCRWAWAGCSFHRQASDRCCGTVWQWWPAPPFTTQQ